MDKDNLTQILVSEMKGILTAIVTIPPNFALDIFDALFFLA